jgi:hypothetical protein
VSDAVIASFLVDSGADPETAGVLAGVARGSFSRALALLSGETAEERKAVLRLLLSGGSGALDEITGLLVGAGQMRLNERRERTAALLSTVHSVVVDALRTQGGGRVGTNLDFAAEITEFGTGIGFERLAQLEKEVHDAIIVLSMYGDVRLVTNKVAPAIASAAAADKAQV